MCSLSPHPQRLLLSNCGGGASPSSHRSSSYLQITALLVSQWVREGGEGRGGGGTLSSLSCHSSQLLVFHPPSLPLAKLCFTSAIP